MHTKDTVVPIRFLKVRSISMSVTLTLVMGWGKGILLNKILDLYLHHTKCKPNPWKGLENMLLRT